MSIKPKIRNNICLNAHPAGCAREVENQIQYVKDKIASRGGIKQPLKAVLVLGCSTGYGLASRITAAFGHGAATIGVSYEKPGAAHASGTPGWYNNLAFDRASEQTGLPAVTINADAYSDTTRKLVIETAKQMGLKFDQVIYSLASPVRTDPDTGIMYRSVLKPIGKPYSGLTVDPMTGTLSVMGAEPATVEEAANTVKVMGGEDWERWITWLLDADLLAPGCLTAAYSYIGPALSHPIYRDGTIGGAKKHLEATARRMKDLLAAKIGGSAFVSVNKGLVTRSSAVIPVIPLYLAVLFKIMKEQGSHEGCIEQIERLYSERICTGGDVPVDSEGLIRIDDWEMDPKVQTIVDERMARINEHNLAELTDLDGYRHDFLAANGFDIPGVDYKAAVGRMDCLHDC